MPKEKETEKKPLNKGLIFKWWGRWDFIFIIPTR